MLMIIFCYLLAQQYADARRSGLKQNVVMQIIFAGWILMLYVLDVFTYIPRVLTFLQHFRIVHLCANLVLIPLGVICLSLQTKRRTLSSGWVMAHLAPYMLGTVVGLFTNSLTVYYAILSASALYGTIMLVVISRAAIHYTREAENEYSSLEGRSFRWLTKVPIFLGMLLPVYAVYCYSKSLCWLFVYQILSLILWGYYFSRSIRMIADRNEVVVDLDELDKQMLSEDENETTNNTPNSDFAMQLKKVCEDGELYLREDLTREDLARAMNTNHTYLTRNLQKELGVNFYTYINSLRVNRAKQLMKSHPEWTLEHLAYDCGYRSRNSFSSAFSNVEGCSPTEWKQRVSSEP